MKKRLTQSEEFDIMKLILDKFLWLGFGVMAFGFYNLAVYGSERVIQGLGFMFSGVILLALFTIIMVKEYEILK
jgi:uncharacterized membrane protein